MPTNFPSGITSQGIPVIPGVPLTTGTYFFVHSGTGADSASGRDKTHPLATVAAAIAKCTANKGDVILLMPGHAETILNATAFNLSIAGVSVIGLGQGLLRPTFTYTTATTATWTVSAANCSITNCHFIANFANVASAFTTAAAKDFAITQNSFVDNSASLNFLCIVTTNATNNDADGLTFTNNYVYSLPATDGAVVSVLGNLLRLNVSYNYVDKPGVTNDAGHLITMSSKVCGGVRIIGNFVSMVALISQATGALFTGSSTTSSGHCCDNYLICSDTTAAILATTGTKISFSQNFMGGVVDGSGIVWPAGDTPS
jgi:hypothetical protein